MCSNTQEITCAPLVPTEPLTAAQKAVIRRKQMAQARLNARLAVQRAAEERAEEIAREAAIDAAYDAALGKLTEQKDNGSLSSEEYLEAKSALYESFYPTIIPERMPSDSTGSSLTGAPRGLGRLVTGGYDHEKLGKVVAAHDRDTNGRKVRPKGTGSKADDEGTSVKVLRGGRIKEAPVKRFKVSLGEDSDNYALEGLQAELERLIRRKEGELSILNEFEKRQRNKEFLTRKSEVGSAETWEAENEARLKAYVESDSETQTPEIKESDSSDGVAPFLKA